MLTEKDKTKNALAIYIYFWIWLKFNKKEKIGQIISGDQIY